MLVINRTHRIIITINVGFKPYLTVQGHRCIIFLQTKWQIATVMHPYPIVLDARTVLEHAMPGVAAGGVERWRDTMARALMLVPFYRHSLKVITDSQNLCLLFGLFNFARIAPCRYASSRFTLASANDTSGYTPSAKSFSLPATQYFNRQ